MACAVLTTPDNCATPSCGSTKPNGVSLESTLIHRPVVTFVAVSSVPLAYSLSPTPMAAPVTGLCDELACTVPEYVPEK